MCIYSELFNKLIETGNIEEISNFMDTHCKVDSADGCPKLCGGCDYLGVLDDLLKYFDGQLDGSFEDEEYLKAFEKEYGLKNGKRIK